MDFVELPFTGLKMFPVLWGIGVLARFITAPNGFIHISLLFYLLLSNEGKINIEKYRQPDGWRK
jgi:hypothetical protein